MPGAHRRLVKTLLSSDFIVTGDLRTYTSNKFLGDVAALVGDQGPENHSQYRPNYPQVFPGLQWNEKNGCDVVPRSLNY